MNRPALILASASPRRSGLLAELGIPFTVVVPEVSEVEDPDLDPTEMVTRNAALKAEAVSRLHPSALVLGADTTVHLEGQALNKPRDLDEARRMLARLSGRTHRVHTGVAIRRGLPAWRADRVAVSEVTFRELTPGQIEDYLARVPVLDKAGAYAIQEEGERIVAGFRGSRSNIIGLPLETVKQILTECGLHD